MLTRDDLIGDHIDPYFGLIIQDQTPVALDKVRFVGDPVAAVAAADDETAAEALDLIHVEYEELPAVFDPLQAMKPGAKSSGLADVHPSITAGAKKTPLAISHLLGARSPETTPR